jgi:hypothetical protein
MPVYIYPAIYFAGHSNLVPSNSNAARALLHHHLISLTSELQELSPTALPLHSTALHCTPLDTHKKVLMFFELDSSIVVIGPLVPHAHTSERTVCVGTRRCNRALQPRAATARALREGGRKERGRL